MADVPQDRRILIDPTGGVLVSIRPDTTNLAPTLGSVVEHPPTFQVRAEALTASSSYLQVALSGRFAPLPCAPDGARVVYVDPKIAPQALEWILRALHDPTTVIPTTDPMLDVLECMTDLALDPNALRPNYYQWRKALGLTEHVSDLVRRLCSDKAPPLPQSRVLMPRTFTGSLYRHLCSERGVTTKDFVHLGLLGYFEPNEFSVFASLLVRERKLPLVSLDNHPSLARMVDRINIRRDSVIRSEFNRIPNMIAKLTSGNARAGGKAISRVLFCLYVWPADPATAASSLDYPVRHGSTARPAAAQWL
ncbi:hypothetical protein NX059_012361 [Plenodomus lindquistii]|nr:hypothetical protein NX059_012143 [Plenodomus lindquistii]KAI8930753.1 hypothetical protein NX059_012361 [Plenodomus lindquistii]